MSHTGLIGRLRLVRVAIGLAWAAIVRRVRRPGAALPARIGRAGLAVVLATMAFALTPGVAAAAQPSNDDYADRQVLPSDVTGVQTISGSNVDATMEYGEFPVDNLTEETGGYYGASVWYEWTAPADEPVAIDTCGSVIGTGLAVFAGNDPDQRPNATQLVAANTLSIHEWACAGSGQSSLIFTATAGTTYYLTVQGARFGVFDPPPDTGDFTLHLAAPAGRPVNDDLSDAVHLSGASGTVITDTTGASAQTGEPDHAGSPAAASAWYLWRSPAHATVTFDTCGSAFDTVLSVYTGTGLHTLTPVAENDDIDSDGIGDTCGNLDTPQASSVSFTADSGVGYLIAVDGKAGASGTLALFFHQDAPPGSDWSAPVALSQEADSSFMPRTAVAPDGTVSVVWVNVGVTVGADNDDYLQFRQIRPDGTPGPIRDLTPRVGTAGGPSIAIRPDGSYVVAWIETTIPPNGQDFPQSRVKALVLAADGSVLDGPITVEGGSDDEGLLAIVDVWVGVDHSGVTTVQWSGSGTAINNGTGFVPVGYRVAQRRIGPDDQLTGPAIFISQQPTQQKLNMADFSRLAVNPVNGSSMTAWTGSDSGGFVRYVAADGTLGPTVQLADPDEIDAIEAVAGPDGIYTISWAADTSTTLIRTQRFSAAGDALGPPVTVSEPGLDFNGSRVLDLSMRAGPDGTVLIMWRRTDATADATYRQYVRMSTLAPDGTVTGPTTLSVPADSEVQTLGVAPSGVLDQYGTATVGWTRRAGQFGANAAQVRRVTGDQLGDIVDLTPVDGLALPPTLAIDSDGTVTAINTVSPHLGASGRLQITYNQLVLADLAVTADHSDDWTTGGTATLTAKVSNASLRASSGTADKPITVTAALPDGVTPTAAAGDGWSCSIDGQQVQCRRTGDIPAGGLSSPINMTVSVAPSAPATVNATIMVAAGATPDPNADNDTVVEAIDIAQVGAVAGTVTDAAGPVPGAQVSVRTGDTVVAGPAATDAAGSYSITGVPVGPYQVCVELAGYVGSCQDGVTVETGTPATVDLSLHVAPTFTGASSGTLTAGVDGTPLVIGASGDPTPTLTVAGALPDGVSFTDSADGTATLGGTPAVGTAGDYPLTVTAANGYGDDAVLHYMLTVTDPAIVPLPVDGPPTPSGDLEGVPAQTTPGQTITVTGTGFAPGATVGFGIYSAPTVLGSAVADASGAATATLTIPQDLSGPHIVVAAGTSSTGPARYLSANTTVSAPGTSTGSTTSGGSTETSMTGTVTGGTETTSTRPSGTATSSTEAPGTQATSGSTPGPTATTVTPTAMTSTLAGNTQEAVTGTLPDTGIGAWRMVELALLLLLAGGALMVTSRRLHTRGH